MSALAARDAYRLWAPTYAAETAISHLDERLVAALTPPLAGLRLLDAGCGQGRRLRDAPAAGRVGVDLSPEMIATGLADGLDLRVGDLRALPLADAAFDVVWCRLAIGHVAERAQVYRELARVAAPGATVIVTDFHPAAHAAGHRRTFRAGAAVHEVEHHVHALADHLADAAAAGLTATAVREGAIGPEVEPFYRRAGKLDLYAEHRGLPVVLALAFRKAPCAS